MERYIIEVWNPEKNKYIKMWEGNSFKMAEIMFNKSYYNRHTRRLIRLKEEILYTEKAQRIWRI